MIIVIKVIKVIMIIKVIKIIIVSYMLISFFPQFYNYLVFIWQGL